MIQLVTPNTGTICSLMVKCLTDLMMHTDQPVIFQPWRTTYIDMSRARALHNAKHKGYSHTLFLDSDMRFPADSLDVLLAHDKDVVGCNYRRRAPSDYGYLFTSMKGEKDVDSNGKHGLEEVDLIGFGVLLIKTSCLASLQEPYFAYAERPMYEGEDHAFCQRCRDAKIPVLVDHDLSMHIGHLAEVEVKI